MAPTIDPDDRRILGAEKFGQHVYASLRGSTEAGAEAHFIVDNTRGKNNLETLRETGPALWPGIGASQHHLDEPNHDPASGQG